jgi:hypothetical protein
MMRVLALALCLACAPVRGATPSPLEKAEEALGGRAYGDALALYQPLAEQGEPEAMVMLARMHAEGLSVERNADAAREWADKARPLLIQRARQGDLRAHQTLGVVYGKGIGQEKDPARAREYLNAALRLARERAARGDAEALYVLGLFRLSGTATPKDPQAGLTALEQAGEMGLWRAQKLLVTAYDCQCMGVARDEAKAEYWRGKLNNP